MAIKFHVGDRSRVSDRKLMTVVESDLKAPF